MVVNENESSVSKNLSQVCKLSFPLKHVRSVSPLATYVVQTASTHEKSYHESEDGRHYLKSFRVLDVSKTEVKGEKSKYK